MGIQLLRLPGISLGDSAVTIPRLWAGRMIWQDFSI